MTGGVMALKDTEPRPEPMPELNSSQISTEIVDETQEKAPDQTCKDSGRAWLIVLASFVTMVLSDGIVFSIGVLYVEFIREFKQNKRSTSVVETILVTVVHVSGLLIEAACRRFGYRAVVITGCVLSAAGYGTSSLTTSIEQIYITIGIIGGIGIGLMFFPAMGCAAHFFDKRISLAMGIIVSGTGVGTFFWSSFQAWLISHIGWRWTVVASAGIILLGIPFAFLYRDPSHYHTHDDEDRQSSHELKELNTTDKTYKTTPEKKYADLTEISPLEVSQLTNKEEKRFGTFEKKTTLSYQVSKLISNTVKFVKETLDLSMLRDPYLVLFYIAVFTSSMVFIVPFSFVPDYAVAQGISTSKADSLISILSISNTVNRIVIGLVSDFKFVNRYWLYTVFMLLTGVVEVLLPFCKTYALLAVNMAIMGMFKGSFIALMGVVLRDIVGDMKTYNRALAFLIMLLGLGNLFHPILGAFHDITGNYNLTFFVAGGLLALPAAILSLRPVVRIILNGRKRGYNELS